MSRFQGSLLHLNVSTPQRPELHLDLSGQKEPVLTLDVYTPQGPELHLEVSGQQELVLLLDVSTLERHLLPLDVSTPQRPLLHLDGSTPQRILLHLDVSVQQEHCSASLGRFWTWKWSRNSAKFCPIMRHEIPRNSPSPPPGILSNFAQNTEVTEVQKKWNSVFTEFRVYGIPWTPYGRDVRQNRLSDIRFSYSRRNLHFRYCISVVEYISY